ncbi:hypothetical protein [Brevibacillus dissolubilis]|uniref:hypothetical protein n=1 Tax=Brevibacillus dissolubilis TaxID=1844116 RepID=UPI0011170EB2|nr:hypothetical protein [Brevibacillus dissolubilis]
MDESRKSKLIILIFAGFVVFALVAAFFGIRAAKDYNSEMIHEEIAKHQGVVQQISVVDLPESPFDKAGKGNTIYKVDYTKDGQTYTAYYRADNQSSIIKEPPEWKFPDE